MKVLIITHPSDADQRLDKFLKKYLPAAPLGAIYKMLRTGKIKVSGKKQDPKYRLQIGDEISVFLHDDEVSALQSASTPSPVKTPKQSAAVLDILYQDDSLLVINKPAGMNVHPGDHKAQEVSLIELVHDRFLGAHQSLTFKPALVHRIDRDTSGCILVALEKNMLEFLLAELQAHRIEKVYHAVVSGKMTKPRATLEERLLRRENVKDEAKVVVHPSGQRAVTHYATLREFQRDGALFSLLECRIETGRTHQIRVHLAHQGHPIIGDRAYGDKSINSFLRRWYGIDRQFLHARSLSFLHPKTKKRLTIEAPYSLDIESFLSYEANQ